MVTALLIALACGSQPSAISRPPPAQAQPSPAASGTGVNKELLFAVLEPGGELTGMRDTAVAIVRVNGTAKAKARFEARTLPKIGNALPLPQPEARVGGGKVFFAEPTGAIKALAVDGTVSDVTSFPVTSSQQELSFAVSPDGSQLLGEVFSFPPVHVPPPQNAIDPPFGPGDFTLQLWAARPGQTPALLAKRNWPQSAGPPRDALELVGWSNEGPLATTDTPIGTQQGSLGRRMFGHVAELDTAGRPGPPLGGYNCDAWSELPDETVVCDDDGQLRNFSVRSKDGTTKFKFSATGEDQYLDLSLAPDAARVAYFVNGSRAAVIDRAGKVVQLPAGFRPRGWLDASTVIGVMQTSDGEGDMALAHVDKPTRLDDLGFHGFFVGVVQS